MRVVKARNLQEGDEVRAGAHSVIVESVRDVHGWDVEQAERVVVTVVGGAEFRMSGDIEIGVYS